MTQSTLAIPNEAGASFRADNNTALQANATFQAGASGPGTTYAYQVWKDTATSTYKVRNAANSAWIVEGSLDESFVISRSSNTILGLSDYGKTFIATSSFTQTLTAAATLGDGWFAFYRNDGTGVITIDPNASETIDGAATIALQPGEGCRIVCNGTAFKTQGRSAQTVTILTSGSGTYNTPLGARKLRVRIVGGGNGGAGSGTGGAAGSNGGNTTFGTWTAGGGNGVTQDRGGAGGTFSGSPTIGIEGSDGASISTVANGGPGGSGGASAFGGAGRGGTTNIISPNNAKTNSGSGGGGGASTSAVPAGAGGASGAFCEIHILTPASSYSYGVGAGGNGGTAGTSGIAGGSGAAGIIVIEEYF